MPSSGTLRCVALIRTDVSDERFVTIIKVTRISELGTTGAGNMYLWTSVLTTATRRHITQDVILHSHRRENLKSYIALTGWTL
jgi:hypothetical protein